MAVKVGDRVYLIEHAYHHLLGEVSEVLGVRRVALVNASRVHSCKRDWERFFAEGCKSDTVYHYIGNVLDVCYLEAIEWVHDLPRPHQRQS